MNPHPERPEDPTANEPVPAQYVAFLDHWRAESLAPPEAPPRSEPALLGWQPDTAASHEESHVPAPPAAESFLHGAAGRPRLRLPRRREAVETLRVRLAPEQLYWLQLAAARAGDKVDPSLLVAAGLALLERLPIDWRAVRSRRDLALALERALELPTSPEEEGPMAPEWPGSPASER
jgi:hypothetical protein